MSPWAVVGNILWLVLGPGIAWFVFWCLSGLILALTVVGFPFAIASFRIAGFAAFPFGRRLVDARSVGEQRIPGTALGNILWFLLAGFWLVLIHAIVGLAQFITIIGIPFALANWKLAKVSLAPLGKRTTAF